MEIVLSSTLMLLLLKNMISSISATALISTNAENFMRLSHAKRLSSSCDTLS